MLKQKIAYIDLSTGDIRKELIPERMRRLYIGGRGINMYLLYNHIEPGIDPLGPKNVLIVGIGILGGTPVPSPSRTQISGLSPLTKCVGDSNMGGFFGAELRFAGFDHLVVTGQAKKPVYLWVHDGEIEIRDADYIWGTDTSDCITRIRERHGDEDIKALMCGQAGENLVRFANVRSGLKSSGGRTGMGCIMGSKKLKCIAVRGTQDLELFDPVKALEYFEEAGKEQLSHRMTQTLLRFGKGIYFGNTNTIGLIRTRNFELNQLLGGDDLEVENMDRYTVGREGCFGCRVHCRHRWRVPAGPFKDTYGVGPEYTTLGSMGTELDNKSMEVVLVADDLVNKWGLDNLETGSMLSWAMELYEKGIITIKDTGIPLEWGNPEVIYEMIRRIAFREGFGDVLADGPEEAIKRIGEESRYYNINVKGMSNLHSDERATPSLALNVAVSTRGSDHLRGRPVPDLFGLPKDVLERTYGGEQTTDYSSYMGKSRMVYWHEIRACIHDSMGNCGMGGQIDEPRAIYYATGVQFSEEELRQIGERIYTTERMFNNRQGRGRADDHLAERYYVEPTSMGMPKARGKTIDREKFEQMLDEYYELHGCDNNGIPTQETLKRLGLDKEPSHML